MPSSTCVVGVKISFNAAVAGECHFKKTRDESAIADVMTGTQQSIYVTAKPTAVLR